MAGRRENWAGCGSSRGVGCGGGGGEGNITVGQVRASVWGTRRGIEGGEVESGEDGVRRGGGTGGGGVKRGGAKEAKECVGARPDAPDGAGCGLATIWRLVRPTFTCAWKVPQSSDYSDCRVTETELVTGIANSIVVSSRKTTVSVALFHLLFIAQEMENQRIRKQVSQKPGKRVYLG